MPQVKELRGDHVASLPVAAMAGATTDNEQPGFVVPFNAKVTAVKWLPAANVTASGTNFSVLSVRNRKADASGTALPASRSYAATNSTAWVPEDCTLSSTAADLLLNAGDILTVQMIHTASGVVIPAGVVRVSYQAR
jgi:hypothetical protein